MHRAQIEDQRDGRVIDARDKRLGLFERGEEIGAIGRRVGFNGDAGSGSGGGMATVVACFAGGGDSGAGAAASGGGGRMLSSVILCACAGATGLFFGAPMVVKASVNTSTCSASETARPRVARLPASGPAYGPVNGRAWRGAAGVMPGPAADQALVA
jgi:hypothetical protein